MPPFKVTPLFLLIAIILVLKLHMVESRFQQSRHFLMSPGESTDIVTEDEEDQHRRDKRQSDGEPQQSADSCTQDMLRGRDGRDGRDGDTGPKGEVGDVGPPGEKGETGNPGIDASNPGSVGTTYVRWGRTTCPSTSQLVYEGVVGGNFYTHTGGGSSYLCLPMDPENLQVEPGTGGSREFLYTTEYEINNFPPLNHLEEHDVPCAVCRVTGRSTLLMIPAKTTCPVDWMSEYRGYMMSAYHGHAHQTDYVCVDENAEARSGTATSTNGALMYLVEATCGSHGLPCRPYVAGNELACVVCTI